MKTIRSLLCLSVITLSIVGCSTYKAPPIPESQMAHIKELDTKEAIIIVHKIDGKMTKVGANEYGLGLITAPHKKESYVRTADHTYDIAPGHRFLDILFQKSIVNIKHKISFNAKAGQSYQLKYSVHQNGGYHFYIEDIRTSKEVPTSQHY